MAYPTASLTRTYVGLFESFVSSAVVSLPATTNAFDEQLIAVRYRQKAQTFTVSTGSWTTVVDQSSTSGGGRLVIVKRTGIYASGTVTLNFSGSVNGIAHGIAVTGTMDAATSAEASAAGDSTHGAPTVTAVGAESLWVQFVGSVDFPRGFTIGSGVTALSTMNDHNYIVGHGVGTKQVVAGATGAGADWTFLDTESPFGALEEKSITASLVFSQPASGAVTITGTAEVPTLVSVVMETPALPLAPTATDVLDITVKDQNNDGIINATPVMSITPAGVATLSTPAVTNSSGVTTTTVTAVAGGSAQITATVAGVTSAPVTIIVTAGGGMPPVLRTRRRRR